MPCSPRKAKKLLKAKAAYVIRKDPFTIKLKYTTQHYMQDLTVGIDTGSKTIGSAVLDEKNRVQYTSEVVLRSNVSENMQRRSMYRRTRRGRKLRYRKCRFLNRRNSIRKDRYAPSIRSKYDAHIKEINFICSLLPIRNMRIETGQFDMHAMQKPWLKMYPWMYKLGDAVGFTNTKNYVLARDNYRCQHCLGKKNDPKLQVHHIKYRSQGGTNVTSNLATLCSTCHNAHHAGMDLHSRIAKASTSTLKHATHMNVIGSMLHKLFDSCPNVEFTSGYVTKAIRQHFKAQKKHYIDAICIAMQNLAFPDMLNPKVIIKRCHAKGNYQRMYGKRSEREALPKKVKGYSMHDKVYRKGEEFGYVIGRRKTGSCGVRDILGVRLSWNTSRLTERVNAATSWIIESVEPEYV